MFCNNPRTLQTKATLQECLKNLQTTAGWLCGKCASPPKPKIYLNEPHHPKQRRRPPHTLQYSRSHPLIFLLRWLSLFLSLVSLFPEPTHVQSSSRFRTTNRTFTLQLRLPHNEYVREKKRKFLLWHKYKSFSSTVLGNRGLYLNCRAYSNPTPKWPSRKH